MISRTHINFALAFNPISCKEYSEKVSNFFDRVSQKRGYTTNLYVTRKQAELLGGYTAEVVTLKNGRTRRATKSNSTQLQSGVKPNAIGARVSYFLKGVCKKTGRVRSFKVTHEYFNVDQCWGVKIALPELHPEWNGLTLAECNIPNA